MNILKHIINNIASYIVLFFLNTVEMIMETAASKLLSPVLGSTNAVWIAIIGIILFATAVGNYAGGKLSTKYKNESIIMVCLLCAVISICCIPYVAIDIAIGIKSLINNTEMSAIITAIVLFLLPSFFLSVLTPVLTKKIIGDNRDIGRISGVIHADIAIGSLLGVLVGGFVLIPNIGVEKVLLILSIVVAFCEIIILRKNKKGLILGIIATFLLTGLFFKGLSAHNIDKILDENYTKPVYIDTGYGRIVLQNTIDNENNRVRTYYTSGAYESGTYLEEEKRNDLLFNYLTVMDKILPYEKIDKTLMIGGAAYMYPKYYISHFPEKIIDVVEIDPVATKIAKEYFFLDELIEQYNLNKNERLGLYNLDARIYINETDEIYNCIINDAFSGGTAIASLATKEALEKYRKHLTPDGLYIANILASSTGKNSRWLKSEYKTAKEIFPFVYIIPTVKCSKDDFVNYIMICSNKRMNLENIEINYSGDEIVLTDDYCPVESLTGNAYLE